MDTTNPNATTFKELLETWNLEQYVDFPTHNREHTLDLLITLKEEIIPNNVRSEGFLADHCVISARLDLPTPLAQGRKKVTFRSLNKIDMTF